MSADQTALDKIVANRKMLTMGVTTIRQGIMLLAIHYQRYITTPELAKVVGSPRPTVSTAAKQLHEKGLIDWEYGTRGRAVKGRKINSRLYYLTSKGERAIKEGMKV